MRLKWISKQETYSSSDISLRVYKQKNSYCGGVIFRNKSDIAISSNGYIQVAIDENRLYFRKSDEKDGYHINTKNKGNIHTKALRIVNEDFYDFCKKYQGNYSLQYDKKFDLYFVAGKEKEQ